MLLVLLVLPTLLAHVRARSMYQSPAARDAPLASWMAESVACTPPQSIAGIYRKKHAVLHSVKEPNVMSSV